MMIAGTSNSAAHHSAKANVLSKIAASGIAVQATEENVVGAGFARLHGGVT